MARTSNTNPPCAEKQLLVCCARTKMPAAVAERLREITAQRLDWDYVLDEAAAHSLGPLLDRHLRAMASSDGSNSIPSSALERLKVTSRANTVRCLFLTAELHKILDVFRSEGLVTIPYKGPVLAEQAYGDLTLRDFDDLDIILPQRDLAKANEVLQGLGYKARFPWIVSSGAPPSLAPGEYNYRNDERRAMVELHTELTLRHFPVVPNLDELAKHLAAVTVGGREVRTFAPEDLLPALCIHGSKDFWARLSWIADISELVQRYPVFDWDRALRTTEIFRAGRMLHLGLALASNTLGAPLPEEIRKRVLGDVETTSLAQDIEEHLLSRDENEYSAGQRFQFRRRMVRGWMAGWRYSVRLAVMPVEEDWETVRLPAWLAPLYIALRPLRLLSKYRSRRRDHSEEAS
jgi:hypothetical protein